ncbi:sigma factor-like helix-turn-helix DNA-binding protein [Streptomyces aquilus]|uniref:sigma factor-like helix-turn-helix DNA-binding protein n=1 Tax=Streptomyces aquilus TaxID=2548456 RepID=UPI00367EED7D
MTRTEEFEEVRPLLLAIAHRILGDASLAEDAVRATGRRWADTLVHPASVQSHLAAEVTRVSTETLRSDRLAQDPYAGPWTATPLLTAPDPDPDQERPAELTDSLLTAALLVLERLSPLERAVFVLREAFGCSVEETAAAVGCSPEACGQLVAAVAATSDGDRDPLPWPTYIAGPRNVARLLAAIVPPLRRIGVTVEHRVVNGRPGSVFRDRTGRILNALTLGVHEGRIEEVHLVVNPDLMAHADPVAEAYAILREAGEGR